MSQPFLSWIEVDLDAIACNVRNLRQFLAPQVRLGIVTKGNAYGHGAPQVTRVALESGADWAIVNRSNEGVQLRQGGITAPVLILGYTLPEEADRLGALAQHDVDERRLVYEQLAESEHEPDEPDDPATKEEDEE